MPAVARLSPSENLELKSIFLVHKKLGDFNPRISCYQLRGGGSSDDMEFVPLDSSMAVNRTTTESGDMHVTITLTVSGSSSRDEGLYQCDFAKSGSSIMVSTLVLLETSTTHLPPNYDYIFMTVSLVLGDGYAKQGTANAITCKRISSIPGLPTLSLNGTEIQLEPSDMRLLARESYVGQWIDYYIPSMGPENSGTYTCGSENGSAQQSKKVIATTEENYVNNGGVCVSLTQACLSLITGK